MRHIMLLTFLLTATKCLAELPKIIPNQFDETSVCYRNESGEDVCEGFNSPKIEGGFGPSDFLFESPRDAQRVIDSLPNFPIAAWHHWLFGLVMDARAQRQYAGCVERIKQSQRLLGLSPLIDDPSHPLYNTVINVREYQVPFHPMQNVDSHYAAPRLFEAKIHAEAALEHYNITVANLKLCEQYAADMEAAVKSQMGKPKKKR